MPTFAEANGGEQFLQDQMDPVERPVRADWGWWALAPREVLVGVAATEHISGMRVYPANHDARAALTSSECGACTDWTG